MTIFSSLYLPYTMTYIAQKITKETSSRVEQFYLLDFFYFFSLNNENFFIFHGLVTVFYS